MYELEYAAETANRLVGILEPCCHRIAVAGSIRRKRPQVHDIDLVIIPNNLSALGMTLLRHGEILTKKRIQSKTKIIKYRFKGMPVDIYVADNASFATLLLIRTGSANHNRRLAIKGRELGLRLKADGQGIIDAEGNVIAWRSEEEIFRSLGMDYIRPEERE